MRHVLLLLILLLVAPAALAQQRSVTASTPANATADVDLTTTVSFTFNGPVTLDAADLVTVLPEFAVTITDTALTNGDQTIEFTVVHEDDADFYWFVAGSYMDDDGNEISVPFPYLLYYTTADDVGPYEVAGSVTAGAGVENATSGVILLDRNPFDLGSGLDSARVAGIGFGIDLLGTGTASFEIDYVREGEVWPFAVNSLAFEVDEDDVLGGDPFADLAVGFYDPNGDRVPDPITVSGDRSGVTIPLYTFASFSQTSSEAEAAAAALVEGDLVDVSGFGVTPEGRATFWGFTYYEAGADSAAFVTILPLFGSDIEYVEVDPDFDDLAPLPSGRVGSDAAFATAEANGGSAFRAEYPEAFILAQAGAEARALLQGTEFEDESAWVVSYVAFDPETFESSELVVVVDLATGDFIGTLGDFTVSAEDEALPGAFTLEANYPNPFNPSTAIPFTIESPAAVRLSVYDALGREVARLVDGTLPAGDHTAVWTAEGQPSGVYLYRIEVGGESRTRPMLLVK